MDILRSKTILQRLRTFEDEEGCLNPHPLFSVPVGSVYGKTSHVLFRVRRSFVLDQSLIERGCNWLFPHVRI